MMRLGRGWGGLAAIRRFRMFTESMSSCASGSTIVCWAPSTIEIKARIIPAYQNAGPDQWVFDKLLQDRQEMIDVNSMAP